MRLGVGLGMARGQRRYGGAAPTRQRLVGAGLISSPLTLLRSQPSGSLSSRLLSDGASWAEVAADSPRFAGALQRLLVGGARTNVVRNPRAAGTAGQNPTNWSGFVGTTNGVTRTVQPFTQAGMTGIEITLDGLCTATSTLTPQFEAVGQIAAANAQVWSQSFAAWVTRGTPADIPIVPTIRMQDAAQAALGTGVQASSRTLGTTPARINHQGATLNQANTAFITPGFRLTLTSGVTYAHTIRIAWPQLEQAPFASSANLPAVGTPAAASRGAELVTAPLATLLPAGTGVVLVKAVLPQLSQAIEQTVVQIDSGSQADRLTLRNSASGTDLNVVTSAASTGGQAVVGAIAAGTAFSCGMWFDGTTLKACLNGAAPVAVTTNIPSAAGLTTLRLGNILGGGAPLSGSIEILDVDSVQPANDAAFQSLVSGL